MERKPLLKFGVQVSHSKRIYTYSLHSIDTVERCCDYYNTNHFWGPIQDTKIVIHYEFGESKVQDEEKKKEKIQKEQI